MKNLFAVILFFSGGAVAQTSHGNPKKYSIEIFDYDFSMAYTSYYHISEDSLMMKSIGELEGEKDSCLVAKKISESQRKKIYDFLCSLDIKNLMDKYENPNVNDGDQKVVIISFKNEKKEIRISNVYLKDMANLFDVINQIVDTRFAISYRNK